MTRGAWSDQRSPQLAARSTRADVAAVLLALLDAPGTVGSVLELVEGDVPIADAVGAAGPS